MTGKTKKVTLEVTDKGAVYLNDTRVTGRETKWGTQKIIFVAKNIPANTVRQTLIKNGFGDIELVPEYCAEFGV